MSEIVMDSKDRQKQFILVGNLWRVMADLSWPAVLAMVLYGLNTVLDAVFVGRFVGEAALAGVSVAYPLAQISVAFGALIGVGSGSVLSIAIGARDTHTQERMLGNVNYLSLIVTVLYLLLVLFLGSKLVHLMGAEGDTLYFGIRYFKTTGIGAFFWIYGLAGNMIVRAEGRMKTASVMMGLGLVINAASNYFLIVLLGMGVEGAAWGTNIGMLAYTIIGWFYFGRGHASFKSRLFIVHRDKEIVRSILRLGASSMLMAVMSLIQAIVVFNALSRYGTMADIAFYGVVFRVFQFLLTPIFGLMRALQPVLGINYGARQYDRVISSYKIWV
jgi:putative MATE family efflux protein